MTKTAHDHIEVRFPVKMTVAVGFLVIGVTSAYWWLDGSLAKTAIFFGTSVAAGASVCIAFYTGRMLNLYLEQNRRNVEQEQTREENAQKERALEYGQRWNGAGMHDARAALRSVMNGDHKDEAQLRNTIEENSVHIIDLMNFTEELAYARKMGLLEDRYLRESFEGVIVRIWQHLGTWVEDYRHRHKRSKIWNESQRLYKEWCGHN